MNTPQGSSATLDRPSDAQMSAFELNVQRGLEDGRAAYKALGLPPYDGNDNVAAAAHVDAIAATIAYEVGRVFGFHQAAFLAGGAASLGATIGAKLAVIRGVESLAKSEMLQALIAQALPVEGQPV